MAEALAGKSPEGETCEEAANSGTYAASRGSSAAAGGCPVTGAPAASASPSGEYPSHGSDTHGCPVGGSGGPFSEPTKQSWPPTPGKSDFYASDTDPTEEGTLAPLAADADVVELVKWGNGDKSKNKRGMEGCDGGGGGGQESLKIWKLEIAC